MSKNKNAYKLGQCLFNPLSKDTWIIYCANWDGGKSQWRYSLIMANESKPKIIGVGSNDSDYIYQERLDTKVLTKKLELI
tara:strand:+ start:786 stop:1025 length:240 start_codon:yes stop_codon:yes gene_type:complete